MFGILCAAIFLLVFLLAGFLLMAKSKRAHSAEIRRLTAEKLSQKKDLDKRAIHVLPGKKEELKDGSDNFGFEEDFPDGQMTKTKRHKNPPDIQFPFPPLHRPSSSSSGTSDSSVYYNKRYRDEAKNIANDPLEPVFYKRGQDKNKTTDLEEEADRIYAMVSKETTHKKSKTRKRYLTENRVGSVEIQKTIVEVISSPSHDCSEVSYAAPDTNYEQMDTFNLREAQKVHDRRNQQLRQALYGSDFEVASSVINSPNEAVNREILKALHKSSDQASADSGSIGSFLSMASLKSFPK